MIPIAMTIPQASTPSLVIPTFVLGHVHIFSFYFKELAIFIVMAGLDPAIHAVVQGDFEAEQGSSGGAWMPGSSPGMTWVIYQLIEIKRQIKICTSPRTFVGMTAEDGS
jgi:hypothetical protein